MSFKHHGKQSPAKKKGSGKRVTKEPSTRAPDMEPPTAATEASPSASPLTDASNADTKSDGPFAPLVGPSSAPQNGTKAVDETPLGAANVDLPNADAAAAHPPVASAPVPDTRTAITVTASTVPADQLTADKVTADEMIDETEIAETVAKTEDNNLFSTPCSPPPFADFEGTDARPGAGGLFYTPGFCTSAKRPPGAAQLDQRPLSQTCQADGGERGGEREGESEGDRGQREGREPMPERDSVAGVEGEKVEGRREAMEFNGLRSFPHAPPAGGTWVEGVTEMNEQKVKLANTEDQVKEDQSNEETAKEATKMEETGTEEQFERENMEEEQAIDERRSSEAAVKEDEQKTTNLLETSTEAKEKEVESHTIAAPEKLPASSQVTQSSPTPTPTPPLPPSAVPDELASATATPQPPLPSALVSAGADVLAATPAATLASTPASAPAESAAADSAAALQAQIDELKGALTAASERAAKAETAVAQAETAVSRSESEREEAAAKRDAMATRLEESEARCLDIKSEAARTLLEKEREWEQMVNEKEAEWAQLVAEDRLELEEKIKRKESEVKELNAELESLQGELEKTRSEQGVVLEKLRVTEAGGMKLRDQAARNEQELEKALCELRVERQEFASRVKWMGEQEANLQREVERLREGKSDAERMIAMLKEAETERKMENERNVSYAHKLEGKLQAKHAELLAAEKRATVYHQNMTQLENEKVILSQQLKRARDECEGLEKQKINLEQLVSNQNSRSFLSRVFNA